MGCLFLVFPIQLILNLFCCSLSLISSLSVMLSIYRNQLYIAYSFRILIYLSINDTVRSLFGFFEYFYQYNTTACMFFAFIDNFLFMSNLSWALCLSTTIYQIIVLEQLYFDKHHKWWFFASYLLVGAIQALPFITQSYKNIEGSCQISLDQMGHIWRYSSFYGPCLIILAFVLFMIVRVFQKVRVLGNIKMKSIIFDRGFVYIYIIIAVLVPFLVIRVVQFFYDGCEVDYLVMVMFNVNLLQGFFNGVVYFVNGANKDIVLKTVSGTVGYSIISGSLKISFASMNI